MIKIFPSSHPVSVFSAFLTFLKRNRKEDGLHELERGHPPLLRARFYVYATLGKKSFAGTLKRKCKSAWVQPGQVRLDYLHFLLWQQWTSEELWAGKSCEQRLWSLAFNKSNPEPAGKTVKFRKLMYIYYGLAYYPLCQCKKKNSNFTPHFKYLGGLNPPQDSSLTPALLF